MRLAARRHAGRRSVLVRADRRPDHDGLCFPICEKPPWLIESMCVPDAAPPEDATIESGREVAMRYEDIIRYVERVVAGGLGWDSAQRAAVATLTTLAECLPTVAAHDLGEQLPRELRAPLARPSAQPQTISIEEFLRRVADREGVSPSEALHHVRAVFDALSEAVTGHELDRVRAHLPAAFETLFMPPAAAGWPETHRHRPHP